MTSAELTARFAGSAAQVGAARWNACANPSNAPDCHPFTRHEFLLALEESGSASPQTGWQPCHLVVERADIIQGLLPLYLKSHSLGEYVFDHGWAEAFERAGGRYYPKLQSSVPFTPVTGPRLLVSSGSDVENMHQTLLATASQAVETLEASSLHITFMTEPECAQAAARRFLVRTGQQFHWENKGYSGFDDFLRELSSSRRKNLRKERESVRQARISFEWLSGREITEAHWDAFFGFYIETGNQKWGTPYLTREFFSRVGESMGDSILLVLAQRSGQPVAGALNFLGEGVLYGRNWGASEFIPFLHFETCYYQAIDFAIAKGLRKVEAGAQGSHKLLRGYRPVHTRSAHFIAHPGLRRAVAAYLKEEREAVDDEIAALAEFAPFRKEG